MLRLENTTNYPTVKALLPEQVEFEVICEPEYMEIEGNCSAIDDETDRETETWIREQLNSGNQ